MYVQQILHHVLIIMESTLLLIYIYRYIYHEENVLYFIDIVIVDSIDSNCSIHVAFFFFLHGKSSGWMIKPISLSKGRLLQGRAAGLTVRCCLAPACAVSLQLIKVKRAKLIQQVNVAACSFVQDMSDEKSLLHRDGWERPICLDLLL